VIDDLKSIGPDRFPSYFAGFWHRIGQPDFETAGNQVKPIHPSPESPMFQKSHQILSKLTFLGVAALVAGSSGHANAASVTVQNFSFEAPALANPGDYSGTIDNWLKNPSAGSASVEYYNGGHYTANNPLSAPAEGYQGVSINTFDNANPGLRATLYQDVGLLLPNTTYTLTVAIGARLDFAGATGSFALFNGADATGTLLATSTALGPVAGTFEQYSISFSTGASVSGDLVVALTHESGGQISFDNIRLDATPTIPEPSACAMMAGGLGVLAIRRKRRSC
jgi:hypothetical protein